MRGLFILGTVVVLGCSMWVSFNHTLDLYMAGNFRNGLEWGGTIAAEVAFIMGVLSMFDSHRKGSKPPWQAKMLFTLGLIVVGWSNICAGVGYEWMGIWDGVILGLLIPVFIFGAEAVLSHAYISRRNRLESRSKMEDPSKLENLSKLENSSELESSSKVENLSKLETASTVENYKVEEEKLMPKHISNEVETSKKLEMEGDSNSEESFKSKNSSDVESTSNDMENTSEVEKKSKVEEVESGEDNTEMENKVESVKVENEPSNKVEDTTKVESKVEKMEDSSNVDDLEEVIECARRLQKTLGKLPGRKRLMEEAGCKEWAARKALQHLKKTG